MTCHYYADACEGRDGDVRLAEGNSVYEGLVEVCIEEKWSLVCSDGWSVADTNVTCQQLGHHSNGCKTELHCNGMTKRLLSIINLYCNVLTVDVFLILWSVYRTNLYSGCIVESMDEQRAPSNYIIKGGVESLAGTSTTVPQKKAE